MKLAASGLTMGTTASSMAAMSPVGRTLDVYSAETSVGPLRRLEVAGGATPGSSA